MIRSPVFRASPGWEIILASASPRRERLLAELGLCFTVKPHDMQERPPQPEEDAAAYVCEMARLKGSGFSAASDRNVALIAADTAVVCKGKILGKPCDTASALAMLQLLNGVTHEVISAVYVAGTTFAPFTLFEKSLVTFDLWPPEVLLAYVSAGESLDKAGGYALQGAGGFLISKISGSPSNVIGLPLASLVSSLISYGIIQPVS